MRKICIIKSKRVPLDLEKSIDGGTINFIYIVKTLQKDKNNEITILTRNEYNDAVTEIVIVNEIKMVLLPYEKSFDTQIMIRDYQEGKSFCLSVNNYLESNSFHIIHTHHWSSAIQLKINNTFWIHTPHLLAYAKKHYIDFLCPNYIIDEERNILENSDKIIALSSAEKFDMLKNYFIDEKKIFVIPNGISELFFKKNTNQRNFSNQIVTIARIAKQKRIDLLIETIYLLKKKGIDINLVIIGDKYFDDNYFDFILGLIQQRELQNNIKITGEINQDEIKSIFDNSFAYIQTSSYESQGIAIFEAMATGLPILTTNQLALEGIFQDGQNGFFIDYDPQDIGQKICIIFNNELLFSKISSNNIIKSQFFIWDNTIFQTLNVYLSYVK